MGTLNLGTSGKIQATNIDLSGNWADAPPGTVIQLLRHHRGTGQWASTSSSYQAVSNLSLIHI